MREYLRRKFVNWLVRGLFNALTPEDILTFLPGGGISYRGKSLAPEQIEELKESAQKFSESAIWKLLSDDAKYHANYLMYEKSEDYGGMMFGKAVLYAVDIIGKRVKQLSM